LELDVVLEVFLEERYTRYISKKQGYNQRREECQESIFDSASDQIETPPQKSFSEIVRVP
jgi:hypothetical protein